MNIPVSPVLEAIFQELRHNDIKALIVGGAVRDAMMGYEPKDIDIELYDLNAQPLPSSMPPLHKAALNEERSQFLSSKVLSILQKYGKVNPVGRSFAVMKFVDKNGDDYDFSIPRTEIKTGTGHKDFLVMPDPSLTPQQAAERRDFTINTLAYDPLTLELHDYFGGQNDLASKTLRHTSEQFKDDPLRVLRGMQFAARFDMKLAPETAKMIQKMTDDHSVDHGQDIYSTLSKERVAEEWMKLVTKGKNPGTALQYLLETGWLQFYPTIEKMIHAKQDEEWHPEGNSFQHTAHVMNAAAEIADRDGLKGDDRAALIFAALGHDLAKGDVVRDSEGNPKLDDNGNEIPITQLRNKNGVDRWTAHGHEEASGPLARKFMQEIGIKSSIINRVVPIIERHLGHLQVKSWKNPANVRALADQLAKNKSGASIQDLLQLIEADHSGRPPLPKELPADAAALRQMAEEHGVLNGLPPLLWTVRDDIKPLFGDRPDGPHLGEASRAAYNAWLKGQITTKDDAKSWIQSYVMPQIALIDGNDLMSVGVPQGPELKVWKDKAFQAQLAGAFNDKDGAMNWLRQQLTQS